MVMGRSLNIRTPPATAYTQMETGPDVAAFVFASDASAVIEHTKNVMFMEDGDLVHIANGSLEVRTLTVTCPAP